MKKQTLQILKKILITWSVVLVVLGFGLYTLSLGFTEGYEFHKGSYAYYVLMPKNMREIPTVGHVKHEPIYRYSVGDGRPPNTYDLIFETDLSPDAVKNFYRAYFSQQGLKSGPNPFLLPTEDAGYLGFSIKDGHYDINVSLVSEDPAKSASDEGTLVMVTFNEDY